MDGKSGAMKTAHAGVASDSGSIRRGFVRQPLDLKRSPVRLLVLTLASIFSAR